MSWLGDLFGIGTSIANTAINQQNLKKQWEREDTAVQRRASDLEAAGLSKNLAAGSAASSTYADTGKLGASDFELKSIQEGLKAQRKQNEQTDAQIALIGSQKADSDASADVKEAQAENIRVNTENAKFKNEMDKYALSYAKMYDLALGQGFSGVGHSAHTIANNLQRTFGSGKSPFDGIPTPSLDFVFNAPPSGRGSAIDSAVARARNAMYESQWDRYLRTGLIL